MDSTHLHHAMNFVHRKMSAVTARTHPTRRGAALLLVLVGLAILTVMVLSLFVNINSELHSSKIYASGSSVKLLSQSAVSLVMAEIYQATSDPTLCWASQPGMIRTYNNSGAPSQYFKLYSDSNMIGPGPFDHTVAGLVPDGTGGTTPWYNQKGVYVDLNQPLSVNGANQYPILDGDSGPNDLIKYAYPNTLPTQMTPAPSGGTVNVLGPTWSNNGVTTPQVAGFWLNGNTPVDPTSINQAPMPVKWLYVLRDGRIAVPDSNSGGSTVTFNNSPVAPSSTDPITGRIAFWTDDETGKVNINTASEGSYNKVLSASSIASSFTDAPRVFTPFDLNLATCPPFQNEFQRYPGHPATVSLSTVFGNLTTVTGPPAFPENIYATASTPGIAPRTIGGGSKEATIAEVTTGTGAAGTGTALALLSNRLYATPDEFLLQPTRSLTSTEIDSAAMKRAQFFITASSRAPDVNLFNLPRICLWPISYNVPTANYQTPFDQFILFCTTIAGQPYYFQRKSCTSQTEWNTPARNLTLINYLKYLCGQAIPGFGSGSGGATFVSKYNAKNSAGGTEIDQILMEIFDYIRSTNIYDSSLSTGNQFNPIVPDTHDNYGLGEVVPSYNSGNDTKGFGRYPTISRAGVLFIAAGDSTHPQVITGGTSGFQNGPTIAVGKTRVQAALMFQLFDPSQGYVAISPDCSIKIDSGTNMTWNAGGSSVNMFPLLVPGNTLSTATAAQQEPGWSGNMGTLPFLNAYLFAPGSNFLSWVPTSPTQTPASSPFPFPDFSSGGNAITFGGTLKVDLITISGQTVQTFTFTFPNTTLAKVPSYVPPATFTNGSSETVIEHFTNFTSPDAPLPYRAV
jgi:uncharacterized protein (TIGR02600 family)